MTQPALFQAPGALHQPHPTQPGNLPTWIAEQLQANKTAAASRIAKFHHCRTCHHIILTGLDNDTGAWTVHADPTPITTTQEKAAIIVGRRTFHAQLEPTTGYRLTHRDPHAGLPPRIHGHHVLPEHQCGATYQTDFIHPPTNPNGNDYGVPDEPDF